MISVQKYESTVICRLLKFMIIIRMLRTAFRDMSCKKQLKPALRERKIRNSFINKASRIRIKIWGNL